MNESPASMEPGRRKQKPRSRNGSNEGPNPSRRGRGRSNRRSRASGAKSKDVDLLPGAPLALPTPPQPEAPSVLDKRLFDPKEETEPDPLLTSDDEEEDILGEPMPPEEKRSVESGKESNDLVRTSSTASGGSEVSEGGTHRRKPRSNSADFSSTAVQSEIQSLRRLLSQARDREQTAVAECERLRQELIRARRARRKARGGATAGKKRARDNSDQPEPRRSQRRRK